MQKIIIVVGTQSAENGGKTEIRNKESCFKAKVFDQKKDSQLPGLLPDSLCLHLKVQKFTEYWRIKHWRREHGVENSKLVLNTDYLKDKSKNISSTRLFDYFGKEE